jgi:gamma-glutamyl-gamma-aminobutyrate hydrolase PuuD
MTWFKFYSCVLLLFLLKLQIQNADAHHFKQTCHLKKSETLYIGCTDNCQRLNNWAVRKAAKLLKYNVKTVDMSSKKGLPRLELFDGFLMPGGADINPDYYIKDADPLMADYLKRNKKLAIVNAESNRRDPFEYAFAKEYFRRKDLSHTPILAICRGMQMLTVSQGIPLYLDLKTELGIRNRRYTIDKIKVTDKDSLLASIQGQTKFRAVKNHHQGLRLDYFQPRQKRWPHLKVTSLSNGGRIAESLEFKNRPIIAVQSHPEMTFGRTRRNFFKWFLHSACEKRQHQKRKKK